MRAFIALGHAGARVLDDRAKEAEEKVGRLTLMSEESRDGTPVQYLRQKGSTAVTGTFGPRYAARMPAAATFSR